MAGTVGPGYLAVGSLLARATGLDPGPALIVLSRLCFLFLLGGVLLAARSTRGRFSWPVLGVLAAAVLLSPWRVYSDVPWTHPLAAALLLGAVVALRPGGGLPLRATALGAGGWLLAQTRSFELQALVAAALVSTAIVVATRLRSDRSGLARDARALLPGLPWLLGGGSRRGSSSGGVTGAWRLFGQYQSDTASAAGTLGLDLGSVPTKLVQLFVDPCYRTFCGPVGDYTPQGLTPDVIQEYWRQPLLLQLPFTAVSLAVVLLGSGVLLARRVLPPFDVLVATAAAGALVLGYTANPIGGGAHLKYGFVRDFTAPAALLLYAAGRTLTTLVVERPPGGPPPPLPVTALLVARRRAGRRPRLPAAARRAGPHRRGARRGLDLHHATAPPAARSTSSAPTPPGTSVDLRDRSCWRPPATACSVRPSSPRAPCRPRSPTPTPPAATAVAPRPSPTAPSSSASTRRPRATARPCSCRF